MIHQILADVVLVLHFAFIVFVIAGGFLALRWRRLVWVHVPTAAWGVLVEVGRWVCPLTPLEQWLRRQGDGASYTGGFLDHYLMPIIYPPGLTHTTQVLLGMAVLLINVIAYTLFFRRRRRARGA